MRFAFFGALTDSERAPTSMGGVTTPLELEVLRLVADGLTTKGIAAALHIAPGTVRKHVDNALAKLGVNSRAGAVRALFAERVSSAPQIQYGLESRELWLLNRNRMASSRVVSSQAALTLRFEMKERGR
jgi:DNA-binding CsgD family transcriptional regulator